MPAPSPHELWRSLRNVHSLSFEARSETGTGWSGSGTGTVIVTEPSTGVLVFTESGEWQPNAPGRNPIRFTNVFRWSAMGDAIRLEHLRFGPERPVYLFDLALSENGEWREVSPHQCNEDCYTAKLALDSGRLLVNWKIQGPQMQESIAYTYW